MKFTAFRSTQTQHPSSIYILLFLFSAVRYGPSLDHLQEEDTSTCCTRGLPLPRKHAGPSFVVPTHRRTAPRGCKFAPRNFLFSKFEPTHGCAKDLIVKIYFCEVSYLLTVLCNDVANFVHYVAYWPTNEWVWSTDGMTLTGGNRSTGRKICPIATFYAAVSLILKFQLKEQELVLGWCKYSLNDYRRGLIINFPYWWVPSTWQQTGNTEYPWKIDRHLLIYIILCIITCITDFNCS